MGLEVQEEMTISAMRSLGDVENDEQRQWDERELVGVEGNSERERTRSDVEPKMPGEWKGMEGG